MKGLWLCALVAVFALLTSLTDADQRISTHDGFRQSASVNARTHGDDGKGTGEVVQGEPKRGDLPPPPRENGGAAPPPAEQPRKLVITEEEMEPEDEPTRTAVEEAPAQDVPAIIEDVKPRKSIPVEDYDVYTAKKASANQGTCKRLIDMNGLEGSDIINNRNTLLRGFAGADENDFTYYGLRAINDLSMFGSIKIERILPNRLKLSCYGKAGNPRSPFTLNVNLKGLQLFFPAAAKAEGYFSKYLGNLLSVDGWTRGWINNKVLDIQAALSIAFSVTLEFHPVSHRSVGDLSTGIWKVVPGTYESDWHDTGKQLNINVDSRVLNTVVGWLKSFIPRFVDSHLPGLIASLVPASIGHIFDADKMGRFLLEGELGYAHNLHRLQIKFSQVEFEQSLKAAFKNRFSLDQLVHVGTNPIVPYIKALVDDPTVAFEITGETKIDNQKISMVTEDTDEVSHSFKLQGEASTLLNLFQLQTAEWVKNPFLARFLDKEAANTLKTSTKLALESTSLTLKSHIRQALMTYNTQKFDFKGSFGELNLDLPREVLPEVLQGVDVELNAAAEVEINGGNVKIQSTDFGLTVPVNKVDSVLSRAARPVSDGKLYADLDDPVDTGFVIRQSVADTVLLEVKKNQRSTANFGGTIRVGADTARIYGTAHVEAVVDLAQLLTTFLNARDDTMSDYSGLMLFAHPEGNYAWVYVEIFCGLLRIHQIAIKSAYYEIGPVWRRFVLGDKFGNLVSSVHSESVAGAGSNEDVDLDCLRVHMRGGFTLCMPKRMPKWYAKMDSWESLFQQYLLATPTMGTLVPVSRRQAEHAASILPSQAEEVVAQRKGSDAPQPPSPVTVLTAPSKKDSESVVLQIGT
eukprot:GILK01002721.1.p1 GENE.GILK01002721.1~~GILK01002721.1.p1  ORF type:complete len:859 (-),score=119.71 GILK01002721.1:104-2680(-)